MNCAFIALFQPYICNFLTPQSVLLDGLVLISTDGFGKQLASCKQLVQCACHVSGSKNKHVCIVCAWLTQISPTGFFNTEQSPDSPSLHITPECCSQSEDISAAVDSNDYLHPPVILPPPPLPNPSPPNLSPSPTRTPSGSCLSARNDEGN